MKLVSLFSGAGGLDIGFEQSGFKVVFANEFDRDIWETYEKNFPDTELERRSIVDIQSSEIPDCDGIIGGPPCQSWSEAGTLRGIKDHRGQLFFEFVRILEDKKPKFFLAENVSGMLAKRHESALTNIKNLFSDCGYNLSVRMLNVHDYGVPQDRKRVFFVGYRKDIGKEFKFPEPITEKKTLKDAIWDLRDSDLPARAKNSSNFEKCSIKNHEFAIGGFSTIYMSRNRVRSWDEPSYTIQAGGRHAPIHPQAPKMEKLEKNKQIFIEGHEHLYRRLSVRECARIQTFPDEHVFYYKNVLHGYKMVGNAVPPVMAQILSTKIFKDLTA